MKKTFFALLFLSVAAISCKKDDNNPVTPENYLNTTPNSYRVYDYIDNNDATNNYRDTTTSTNRDTTINGKSYHIFTNTSGDLEYYNNTGNDYYQYQDLLGVGSSLDWLYLKTNATVGTTWTQSTTVDAGGGIMATITFTNVINGTGLTRTVSGITYTDVIDVKTTLGISMSGFPVPITSDIHGYYARKVGLIENTMVISSTTVGLDVNMRTALFKAVYP